MNKAEAIEKLESMGFTTMKTAVDIINSIQPITDEAWEVIANSLPYSVEDLKNKLAFSVMSVDFGQTPKVVIPKFVAEYIEHQRNGEWSNASIFSTFATKDNGPKLSGWFWDGNGEILFNALANDYEVEKEKLYRVELPVEINSTIVSVLKKYPSGEVNIGLIRKAELKTATRIRFTEQQIKSIDERYWAFAVEVEDAE